MAGTPSCLFYEVCKNVSESNKESRSNLLHSTITFENLLKDKAQITQILAVATEYAYRSTQKLDLISMGLIILIHICVSDLCNELF